METIAKNRYECSIKLLKQNKFNENKNASKTVIEANNCENPH